MKTKYFDNLKQETYELNDCLPTIFGGTLFIFFNLEIYRNSSIKILFTSCHALKLNILDFFYYIFLIVYKSIISPFIS